MPDGEEISRQRGQPVQKHRDMKGEDTLGEVQVVLYCWGCGGEGAWVRWKVVRVMVKDFLKALGFQTGQ